MMRPWLIWGCCAMIKSPSFTSLKGVLTLNFKLVSYKQEYYSAVWNSLTSTDSNKLELIQWKPFFPGNPLFPVTCHTSLQVFWSLETSHLYKMLHFRQTFCFQSHNLPKIRPYFLWNVGLRLLLCWPKDSEVLLCLLLVLDIANVVLLDVHQLIMPSVVTLVY
jgi:hypothetical protein